MRVVQVAAHQPPEPLTRSLRDAGHQVVVLAGSLDERRAPMTVWDETDGGVLVRWIATHPYRWPDDPRHHDNPAVTTVADALYREVEPDVVHCHSLDGLGVGVIDAAATLAIPVVVTMHDFWWICARRCLVDADGHPCSLVIAASDCPCDAGRGHLAARWQRLAAALAKVDQVLVPSRLAAAVLVANGVDPSRVEVDEERIAPPPRRGPEPSGPGPATVTVRYTGGSDPMHGADVLLDAVTITGRLPRVRVVAHGLREAVTRRRLDPATLAIDLVEPFGPLELDAVLSGTDVLLVPSVQRAASAITAREALVRGVPVIATDSLGAEEVVHDRVNGRVIPAGEAGALADVLRTISATPSVVQAWRHSIGHEVPRWFDDQVTGLIRRYETLARTGHRALDWPPDVRALFVVGTTEGGALRRRAQVPAESLRLVGARATVCHHQDPAIDDAAAGVSHVVLCGVPASATILDRVERWRAAGTPVAFDLGDMTVDPDLPDLARVPAASCDALIGSTRGILDRAAVTGLPAHLIESGVDPVLAAASDRARRRSRRPGPLRVGCVRSASVDHDAWSLVAPAVQRSLAAHAGVELLMVDGDALDGDASDGATPDHASAPTKGWVGAPPAEWWERPEVLRDLDVLLVPLAVGHAIDEARPPTEWLDAALCETPVVAAATQSFRSAIEHGRTGFLAATPDEWEGLLDELLQDEALRARVGRAARRSALLRWSPYEQGRRYLDVLTEVGHAHRRRREPGPAWAPDAADEPVSPAPVALDPYPPPGLPTRTWTTSRAAFQASQGPWLGRSLRELRRSWSDHGAGVTLARAGRAVTRRLRISVD